MLVLSERERVVVTARRDPSARRALGDLRVARRRTSDLAGTSGDRGRSGQPC